MNRIPYWKEFKWSENLQVWKHRDKPLYVGYFLLLPSRKGALYEVKVSEYEDMRSPKVVERDIPTRAEALEKANEWMVENR